MSSEILQEYLVKLGYKTDTISLAKFTQNLTGVQKRVTAAGIAVAGVVTTTAAAAAAFSYSMRKMYFASELANSSVKNLKGMEYAGQQIGVSGEAMASSIHDMAQALRLNPGLTGFLNSLGVPVTGRDMSDVMVDLVAALSKMPEYQATQIAGMFGISPDEYHQMVNHLDTLLEKKKEHAELYQKMGVDVDAAKKTVLEYTQILDNLKVRIEILGEAILMHFVAPFKEATKWLDESMSDMSKWITGDMTSGDMFDDLATKAKHGVETAQREIDALHPGGLAGSALGKLISRGEGGYGSVNLGKAGNYRAGKRDLENMTVSQVMAAQRSGEFNAVGRYQLIKGTLADAVKDLGLSGSEKFDKATQDMIFEKYLLSHKQKAIGDYLSGKTDDIVGAAAAAAREWASIADPFTGQSHYAGVAGNRASVSPREIMGALETTRLGLQQGAGQQGVQVTQNNTFNVTGTEAKKIAEEIATQQDRVNANTVRQFKERAR
jgi:hypothetical protein